MRCLNKLTGTFHSDGFGKEENHRGGKSVSHTFSLSNPFWSKNIKLMWVIFDADKEAAQKAARKIKKAESTGVLKKGKYKRVKFMGKGRNILAELMDDLDLDWVDSEVIFCVDWTCGYRYRSGWWVDSSLIFYGTSGVDTGGIGPSGVKNTSKSIPSQNRKKKVF